MKVYRVESDGTFTECFADQSGGGLDRTPIPDDFTEEQLQKLLKKNPNLILEDEKLMLVGSCVQVRHGGLYREIDLFGLDREGRTVVVELKLRGAPRRVVAQALEYAAIAESLTREEIQNLLRLHKDDESAILTELHSDHFDLTESAVIEFNENQRIVIVAEKIMPEIRVVASFLESKGIPVTCVEFSFRGNDGGSQLLALAHEEVVDGREPPARSTPTKLKEREFIKRCDKHGRAVFEELLEWFHGQNGFKATMNEKSGFTVRVDGIVVCYCNHKCSHYGQSLHTDFRQKERALKKQGRTREEKTVARLRRSAERTGLFAAPEKGRKELTIAIDKSFAESKTDERERLRKWFESVPAEIEHSRSVT